MENSQPHKIMIKEKCNRIENIPIMGIFLIGIGVAFLLNRLQVIPSYWSNLIMSWQSLLIFIGVINVFKRHARFPGLILILIGVTFLLPDAFDIPFETRQLIWPVLLIIIGLVIVLKTRNLKIPKYEDSDPEYNINTGKIDEVAIFGGGKRVISNQNLQGGNITAIFGGVDLDLTEADFADDYNVLEVTCIFGGVTVITKPEWDIQVHVASILGGFSDKRKVYKRDDLSSKKTLVIKGAAIFGGGEIK